MFCIGFTKKQANSQRKTCYAQSAQKRSLRAKMVEIMSKEASTCDLKELVIKLMPETLGKDIEKACNVRGCGRLIFMWLLLVRGPRSRAK